MNDNNIDLVKSYLGDFNNISKIAVERQKGKYSDDALFIEFVYGDSLPDLVFRTELSYQFVGELAEQEGLQDRPLLKYLIAHLATESLRDFCKKEQIEWVGL